MRDILAKLREPSTPEALDADWRRWLAAGGGGGGDHVQAGGDR